MGLHTGDPRRRDEGYVGIDVHRGARVAALAHGGQVILSADAARSSATSRCATSDAIASRTSTPPASCFSSATGVPAAADAGRVDLPTPATPFLGRERELFDAAALWLDRDPRVLTIVGPGWNRQDPVLDRARPISRRRGRRRHLFVPSPRFGTRPRRAPDCRAPRRLGDDAAAIATRIGEKPAHVVLDNLEQLLPGAARPLAELVAAAPALRIVATSREPLRIAGETEFDLPPMDEDDAVALFIERAQAVAPTSATRRRPRADPTASTASRSRSSSPPRGSSCSAPSSCSSASAQRLDLLKGGRDADERHATLRATIAWSYDLLDDDEQALFARLAVFRGGCTIEAAEAVCDADLDTLASLLDKSLAPPPHRTTGEERFWMLETIREFALERRDAAGEANALRRRHAEHFLALGETANLAAESDGPERAEIVRAEQDNFRSAIDWAIDHDLELAFRLTIALEQFWVMNDAFEGVGDGRRCSSMPRKSLRSAGPRSEALRRVGVHRRRLRNR